MKRTAAIAAAAFAKVEMDADLWLPVFGIDDIGLRDEGVPRADVVPGKGAALMVDRRPSGIYRWPLQSGVAKGQQHHLPPRRVCSSSRYPDFTRLGSE